MRKKRRTHTHTLTFVSITTEQQTLVDLIVNTTNSIQFQLDINGVNSIITQNHICSIYLVDQEHELITVAILQRLRTIELMTFSEENERNKTKEDYTCIYTKLKCTKTRAPFSILTV